MPRMVSRYGIFGAFSCDVHAVALLQPADDDFDMLLSGARQQKLVRLRVAIEAQRLVFFQHLLHRVAHAVFILPRLGGDGVRRWTAPAISTCG